MMQIEIRFFSLQNDSFYLISKSSKKKITITKKGKYYRMISISPTASLNIENNISDKVCASNV